MKRMVCADAATFSIRLFRIWREYEGGEIILRELEVVCAFGCTVTKIYNSLAAHSMRPGCFGRYIEASAVSIGRRTSRFCILQSEPTADACFPLINSYLKLSDCLDCFEWGSVIARPRVIRSLFTVRRKCQQSREVVHLHGVFPTQFRNIFTSPSGTLWPLLFNKTNKISSEHIDLEKCWMALWQMVLKLQEGFSWDTSGAIDLKWFRVARLSEI